MFNAAKVTVRHLDQNYGPYAPDELHRLVTQGTFSPNDLAWVEGTPQWTRLAYVPGAMPPPPMPAAYSEDEEGEQVSDRLILPAFLLAFFIGVLGVHRFYVGKTGSGIVMLLLTLTIIGSIVSGIWALVDWIVIVCGGFRDAEDRRLVRWT